MTGIEKITARILADAKAEADAIKAQSDAECAGIRAENERRAEERYEKLVSEGEKETEQRASRMERTASLEAKKGVLSAKQQSVSRAFELAKEKIAALPEADYVAFLARQAAAAALTGEETVILCEEDRDKLGEKIVKAANELISAAGKKGELKLSGEARPMSGGLVLKRGDIEVNCTVDTLLDLGRGELAAQVAEVLFGA